MYECTQHPAEGRSKQTCRHAPHRTTDLLRPGSLHCDATAKGLPHPDRRRGIKDWPRLDTHHAKPELRCGPAPVRPDQHRLARPALLRCLRTHTVHVTSTVGLDSTWSGCVCSRNQALADQNTIEPMTDESPGARGRPKPNTALSARVRRVRRVCRECAKLELQERARGARGGVTGAAPAAAGGGVVGSSPRERRSWTSFSAVMYLQRQWSGSVGRRGKGSGVGVRGQRKAVERQWKG